MDITNNRDFDLSIVEDILAITNKDIMNVMDIVSNKKDIDTLRELHTDAYIFSTELEDISTEKLSDCIAEISALRMAAINIGELPRNRAAKEKQRVEELSAVFCKLENNAQESLIDDFYSARRKAMSCISECNFSDIENHILDMTSNYLLEQFRNPSMQESVFDFFCKQGHLTFESEEYLRLIKQGKQALEECNNFELVKNIIKMSQLIAIGPSDEMVISAINDVINKENANIA